MSDSGDGHSGLVQRLLDDHREAEQMLERFDALLASRRDEGVAEEAKAEHLLADMERAGVFSPEFTAMFTTLRTEVLTHAGAEEESVLPELAANVPADDLRALATRYEMAKRAAPTRPYHRVRT